MKIPEKFDIDRVIDERFSPEIHDKLKNARIAVAGLGGLGSNAAMMLARSGIGTLHLVDFDRVDLSNLNRQNYYIEHLGMEKTEATREVLLKINPYLNIITDAVKIDSENALSVFRDDIIVIEAFDRAENKAMLISALLSRDNEKIIISGNGLAGYSSSNTITTKKINDRLYMCGDGTSDSQKGMGLMSARVSICAAHEANMAVRLVLGDMEV